MGKLSERAFLDFEQNNMADKTLFKQRGPPLIKALLLTLSHLGIYFTYQTVRLTAISKP